MRREDHHLGVAAGGADGSKHVEPVVLHERQVEEYEIGLHALDERDDLAPRRGSRHDFELAALRECFLDCLDHQRMVFGDEDPQVRHPV